MATTVPQSSWPSVNGVHALGRPLVPALDVEVGAADARRLDLDQDLVRTRGRYRELVEHEPGLGVALANGAHRLHDEPILPRRVRVQRRYDRASGRWDPEHASGHAKLRGRRGRLAREEHRGEPVRCTGFARCRPWARRRPVTDRPLDVRRRRHSADARGVDRASAPRHDHARRLKPVRASPNTQADRRPRQGRAAAAERPRGTRVQRPEVLRDPREPLAGVGEDDDRRPARLQLEPRATVENRGGDTSNGHAIEVGAERRVVQREMPSAGGPDLDLDRGRAACIALGNAVPVDERDVLGRVGATQDGFERDALRAIAREEDRIQSPKTPELDRDRARRSGASRSADEHEARERRRAEADPAASVVHLVERDDYRPSVGCGVVAVALLEALRVPPPHP